MHRRSPPGPGSGLALLATLVSTLACGGAATPEPAPEPPPPVVVPEPAAEAATAPPPAEPAGFDALPASWTQLSPQGGGFVVWHYCNAETPSVTVAERDGVQHLDIGYGQDGETLEIAAVAASGDGWELTLATDPPRTVTVQPEVPDWSMARWTLPEREPRVYAPSDRLDGYEQVTEPPENCWEEETNDVSGLESLPQALRAWDGSACSNGATIDVRGEAPEITLDQGGDRRTWPVAVATADNAGIHLTLQSDAGLRGATFVYESSDDTYRVRFPDFEEQVFVDVARCAP